MIGLPEIITIAIVALILIFGGKKIPELMKGLGQGIKEFKKSSRADVPDTNNDLQIKE